ncbi:MAG: SCP2 sterol-binding domain-containing protein [Acidimicrobiales bacterium]
MDKLLFLSDEWTAEVKRLHAEVVTEPPAPTQSVRMNLVLTQSPLGDGTLEAHVDTSSGELVVETGHVDSPDLTVTVDYDTAKAILVDGDAQAAMQAFMSGRIRIDGDMTMLLALQSSPVDPVHQELAARVREITA